MERTIKTSAGDIRISGLKRRQTKQLKDAGFNLYKSPEDHEAYLTAILDVGVHPDDKEKLDDLFEYEAQDLMRKVTELTFLSEAQRKNYEWQWDSTLPGKCIPAATAENTDSKNEEAAQKPETE